MEQLINKLKEDRKFYEKFINPDCSLIIKEIDKKIVELESVLKEWQ